VPVFPIFLKLERRKVLLVGGGAVAAGKLQSLLDAGAEVRVVAPDTVPEVVAGAAELRRRPFEPRDLDEVVYVVAAAPRSVNAQVAREAAARGLIVNAVDDVEHCSAYMGAVLRRAGVTIAISTDGEAPALAGLIREALERVLPADLDDWMACARGARTRWLSDGVAMAGRRPLLLAALMALYEQPPHVGVNPR
jgi:siroheme synthase-like protein